MVQTAAVSNSINPPQSGYIVQKKNPHLDDESHIVKKHPFIGAKNTMRKLGNSVFYYAPKGMKGSVNSNFHEYLSMGLIPYVTGSAVLIGLFNFTNVFFAHQDKASANFKGAQMAAGVVLYGLGKWLGNKLITKGVHAKTGIDMDMPYEKVVNELPDYKGDEKTLYREPHKVYESVEFPRWDLLNQMGEREGNRYKYWDKIAKKMGHKEKLNSPDQEVQPKIKKVITKARAAQSISSFLWAATGVALGAQKPFGHIFNFSPKAITLGAKLKEFPKKFGSALVQSTKDLYTGKNADGVINKKSRAMGRTLIFATLASTALGIANACIGFKAKKENGKVVFDPRKEIVEG